MIECPKCQHDNDLGRIFCAKCGEKLEISKVRAPSRMRKGKKGHRDSLQKTLAIGAGKLFKVVILAFVAALLFAMWLPPKLEKIKFNDKHVVSFQEKREQLDDALNAQTSARIVFTEPDLNAYLSQVVKKTKAVPGAVNLDNIYIKLRKSDVQLTVQNKWKWFYVGVQVDAQPVHKNGRWQFKPHAIRIGRLNIPQYFYPQITDTVLKNLWSSFGQERGWVEQVAALQVAPGEIQLLTSNPD